MHIVMDYMNVGSLQDLIEKLPDERIIPNEPLKFASSCATCRVFCNL